MSVKTIMMSLALLLSCVIASRVSSDEEARPSAELERLRQQVDELKTTVDFLMVEHRFEVEDMQVLEDRIRQAQFLRKRVDALYAAGGAVNAGVHRTARDLRLAQARHALAKEEYDECLRHFDAAVVAAKQYRTSLQARLEAGAIGLDFVVAAQQSVTDLQLQRSQARRRIKMIQAGL